MNVKSNYFAMKVYPRPKYIPLSFSQERLWFIDRLEGSTHYHLPLILKLQGILNTDALLFALQSVVNRHEVLRTAIMEMDDTACQSIMPENGQEVIFIDGTAKNESNWLQNKIGELINQPFDLSKDHAMRVGLITLGENHHVLVFAFHHIAFDLFSIDIILKELTAFYSAFIENRLVGLNGLEFQYADYSIWQRNYFNSEKLDSELAYWKVQLQGTSILQLPADFTRPVNQDTRGASVGFFIEELLQNQLQEFSARQEVSVFVVLLACFKVLLYRYTGQQDICVGTKLPGRKPESLQPLAGFFENALALRSKVNGDDLFTDFLGQVNVITREAFEHGDLPFEKVVDAVVKEREMNRNPLFDVLFLVRTASEIEALPLPGIKLTIENFSQTTALFDITFTITETPQGFKGEVVYATALYKKETIELMIDHFRQLLVSIITNPKQKTGALPMLAASEKQRLLVDFNNTGAPYPDKSITALFEEQATASPDSIAVVFGNVELTYKELNERSNQLAHYLQNQSAVQGSLVPLCVERGVDMIVGLLAILKAGMAFVPLDPEYPLDRISYMLEDSKSKIVISSKESRLKLENIKGLDIIEIDGDKNLIGAMPKENLPLAISPAKLAYVIYTSGSTGKPKGVMVAHSSVVNLLASIIKNVAFKPHSSFLSVTTFSFDICYLEFYVPLISGGKLIVIPREIAADGYKLAGSIARYVPTHVQGTPATWQLLLDSGWENKEGLKILIGGEAVTETIKDQLTKLGDVFNLYGPTETTIWSAIKKLSLHEKVLIGKPLDNTSIYILNEQLELCLPNVAGEICIGGAGLANGYWNLPSLTNEKFIKDPFSKSEGARLYKTGDLGKWLPDGNIQYLSRMDNQVKIRGYRIELGEIETCLQQGDMIRQAIVVAKENTLGIKRLVSYYIPEWQALKVLEKELYLKQVASWQEVYDTEYAEAADETVDEEFDYNIWKDSFTGEIFEEKAMREWLQHTIDIILQEKPLNVLEIGSGKGLIFYRLAGKIKKYIGTDFSASCIQSIKTQISKGVKDYGEADLYVCAAHEVAVAREEEVDTILINSVAQHFPGEDYMNEVIGKSIEILKGKGRIIIGDVRNNQLLEAFKLQLDLQKLPLSVSVNEFLWTVGQEVLKEEELLFSPGFFYNFLSLHPQVTHVDVQLKRGFYYNELSRYRYDVIIYVGTHKEIFEPQWQQAETSGQKQSIINQLQKREEIIAFKNVPNPRLTKERLLSVALKNKIAGTVGELQKICLKEDKEALEVQQILTLASEAGYHISLFPAKDIFEMNVLLERLPSDKFVKQLYLSDGEVNRTIFTNIPLFSDIVAGMQKSIRQLLLQSLPEFMVPAEFIAITTLPLTNNGKVDRKFLSLREDKVILSAEKYEAPHSHIEQVLTGTWQDLLGIDRIGIHDNFFELGGHSLLATRTVSAVRKKLNVELFIKDLFIHPTIALLATHIAAQSNDAVLPGIGIQERPQYIPLSFSQERLWFIDRLEGSLHYHVPNVFRVNGKLNKEALNYAFKSLINRHEVLRTVFREKDGIAYQHILPENGFLLNIIHGIPFADNLNESQKIVRQLINAPFDLSKDHMLRVALITMNEGLHILVVTMHHIASDGWSESILVKEIQEFYMSFEESRLYQLPQLDLQYADFAIWQRKYSGNELLQKKIDYWKNKLQGVSSLKLPVDYARPAIQSRKGAMIKVRINKELTSALQILGQQQGTTLFMTLLAAFKVLLHKYSGQQDICIGTAVAGRQSQELEGLVGLFVNTLALRSELNGNESFVDLLHQVKKITLEGYENQEVPFEKVVDAIVGERELSTDPLVQVMFALQNTPNVPVLKLGETNLSTLKYGDETSLFDLWLNVEETPKGLRGYIKYCTDLFKKETIEQLISHFSKLITSIVRNPHQKIYSLEILSGAERHQLLKEFSNNATLFPVHKSIIAIFEEQVMQTPNNIAVAFEDQQMSYLQLNQRSNQLAHYLIKKGVKNETLVPICIGRGLDLIIVILGILKAGGAYVPLDPDYPLDRINYMLEDTGAEIIIADTSNKLNLRCSDKIDLIEIDKEWTFIFNEPAANLQKTILPDALAYIIYTSGSTGNPKGVMVEHRNVVSLVKLVDYTALTENDILLSTGSSSFDATTFEYWSMLLNGGQLVLCAEDTLIDHQLLKREIRNRRVTKIWFTSGWFNQLAEYDITIFKSLQTILVGGEKLSESHIQKIRQAYPAIEIINGYGPTENTTFSLTYRVAETDISGAIPIGRPLSNRTAYILDEYNQLVPVGVPGEICLGGAGIARGYLNRGVLTSQKFITNPFDNENESKLYKTGDLGKWLPDGNIEYLRRLDDQIKIRGYRVEPGEVETVMNRLDHVKSSCIVVKKDTAFNNRLVAYYQPNLQHVKTKERELYTQLIAGWKELYETEYAKTEISPDIDHEFNIVGWNDSFTGQPISAEQMKEWLNDTIEVIMSEKVENVLEIGIGTGLIYYQLAEKVKKYIGTDFSKSSINQIYERISKGLRNYCPTELRVSAAHEIVLNDSGVVDTIILNSVIQYFPGESYMTDIIDRSVSLLKGNGRIIVGDVRDNRLLELFKSRLQLARLQESASVKELKWAIDREVLKEEELCFSPEYFYRLKALYPQITHLEIKWKQGSFINELTKYRFTVIMHLGVQKDIVKVNWQSWKDFEGDKEIIIDQLEQGNVVAIKNVPNPRLWEERLLNKALQDKGLKTVGDILKATNKEDIETLKIKELLAHAMSKGYTHHFMLDEDPLTVNLVLKPTASTIFIEQPYIFNENNSSIVSTNIPLFADINAQFQKDIRSLLLQKLPEYMVPSEFISLTQFPLTNNGKVDRVFLSKRDDRGLGNKLNYTSPRNMAEQQLANIWQELLAIDAVSIYDNFFEIGGHSLLAIRLVFLVRKEMGAGISTNDVFIYPTIASFAENIINKKSNPALNVKYLVPIKTSGTKTPLYIMAGGGGTARRFIKFASMMDANQPVYALQPPIDARDLKVFPSTVETIAAKFIEEIITVNPNGPYALSGHCLGGIIAFEMARQLEANGKKVHLLVMFDTIIEESVKATYPTVKNLFNIPSNLKQLMSALLQRLQFQSYLLVNHPRRSIRYKMEALKLFADKITRRKLMENEHEKYALEIFDDTADIYIKACKKYEIFPYSGTVICFYAKEHYYFVDRQKNIVYRRFHLEEQTKNRWKQYAVNVRIHDVEGEHSEIFDPVQGDEFALLLQRYLNNGQA